MEVGAAYCNRVMPRCLTARAAADKRTYGLLLSTKGAELDVVELAAWRYATKGYDPEKRVTDSAVSVLWAITAPHVDSFKGEGQRLHKAI